MRSRRISFWGWLADAVALVFLLVMLALGFLVLFSRVHL